MTGESIAYQVLTALNAAHHENGYPHEYWQDPKQIVLDIDEKSGIEGFDQHNKQDMFEAMQAVQHWRGLNPV